MKRLEEMSREELIEEIISNTQRLEEIEAACKEEERKIAELKNMKNCLLILEMQSKTASSICLSLGHSCRSFFNQG